MRTRRLLAAVLILIGRQFRLLGNLLQGSAQRIIEGGYPREPERHPGQSDRQPPPFWPGGPPEPPEHWVAKVREAAPWLLDQIDAEAPRPVGNPAVARRNSRSRSVPARMRDGLQRLLPFPKAPARATTEAGAAAHRASPETSIPTSSSRQGAPKEAIHRGRRRAPSAWSRRNSGRERPAADHIVDAGNGERVESRLQQAARIPPARRSVHQIPPTEVQAPVDSRWPHAASPPMLEPQSRLDGRRDRAIGSQFDERRPEASQRRPPPVSQDVVPEWPALPELPEFEPEDWSVAMRRWNRRQRLDAEQRGEPWNAPRS